MPNRIILIARADVVLLFSLEEIWRLVRDCILIIADPITRGALSFYWGQDARGICAYGDSRGQQKVIKRTRCWWRLVSCCLCKCAQPARRENTHTERTRFCSSRKSWERDSSCREKKTIDERERERATSTRREKNNRTCKGPGTSFSFHDRQSCSRGPSPRTARNYMAYFHISCCCLVPSLFSFQLHWRHIYLIFFLFNSPITTTTPTNSSGKVTAPSTVWPSLASNWTLPAPIPSSPATSTERPKPSFPSKSTLTVRRPQVFNVLLIYRRWPGRKRETKTDECPS